MPIEIIQKRKTTPMMCSQHKQLVPLRVVEHRCGSRDDQFKKYVEETAGIGSICFVMPGLRTDHAAVFNCTTGKIIDSKYLDSVLFVRAYDVQSIILTNDNEPAPVT
jgi:hypothetical protein